MVLSLKVVGENINLKEYNNSCRNGSRKIFSSNWSKVDEYQHEIANHFRDYQNHKKLNRYSKKRRFRPNIVFEEELCVSHDILPLNRINIPELNSCAYHKLFRNCYNNTLQKISSTDSLSKLKFLTKRQERLYKLEKVPSLNHNYCSNNLIVTQKKQNINKTGKQFFKHISTSDLKYNTTGECLRFVDDINIDTAIKKGVSLKKCKIKDFNDDIDNCFFRLASECYDEGFLNHIKYLKSITDRNAKNNAINGTENKRSKLRTNTENRKPNSQPPSAYSSVSSSPSLDDLSNLNVECFKTSVNQLLGNFVFKENQCNNNQHDLKICVNLKRSISLESFELNCQKPKILARAKNCIMSDFLNLQIAQAVSREIVENCANKTIKQPDFHELIENLNRFEINDSSSLPKITISSADDNTKPVVFESDSNNKTFLKQDSLEIGLPFINDLYSSEARPP